MVVLTLVVGFIVIFIPAAPAQNIHVLMMIDNGNPKTGLQHSIDKRRIEGLINTQVKPMLEKERSGATINIDELFSNDGQITSDNIFGWLQNANPSTDDVIFVYFSGHGGADKEGTQERFLYIHSGSQIVGNALHFKVSIRNPRRREWTCLCGRYGEPTYGWQLQLRPTYCTRILDP